jgi:hypothetical protein
VFNDRYTLRLNSYISELGIILTSMTFDFESHDRNAALRSSNWIFRFFYTGKLGGFTTREKKV